MVKTVVACAVCIVGCGGSSESTAPASAEPAGGGEGTPAAPGTEAGAGASTDEGASGEPAEAGAQGRGVETDAATAQSAVMVDEGGRIGFRADVQMELETLPGTPAEAVQKMGASVQRKMTEIRTCYDRAVASDPEIQGVLKLLLETNARRAVSADVTEAGLERGRITDCVLRILRRLPRGELPANARLWVVLRASNTMAAGMSQVRDAQEGQ